MSELVRIFEGSDIEAAILKDQLEAVNIGAMLKSETNSAAAAGFGSLGFCAVLVLQGDKDKASEVLEEFKSRNSGLE